METILELPVLPELDSLLNDKRFVAYTGQDLGEVPVECILCDEIILKGEFNSPYEVITSARLDIMTLDVTLNGAWDEVVKKEILATGAVPANIYELVAWIRHSPEAIKKKPTALGSSCSSKYHPGIPMYPDATCLNAMFAARWFLHTIAGHERHGIKNRMTMWGAYEPTEFLVQKKRNFLVRLP